MKTLMTYAKSFQYLLGNESDEDIKYNNNLYFR